MRNLGLIALFLLQITVAEAIEISVGQGRVAAKPIAVVPFLGNTGADKIDYIVSFDLKQSGVFAPIAPSTYPNRPNTASDIDYKAFQRRGVAYVITGELIDNKLINFIISDTFRQQIVGSFRINIAPRTLRQAAHEVSDIILQKLTGTRGAFSTRLVYVYESGQGSARRYRLMVSDSDGRAAVAVLTSKVPVMSPRFSPDGKQIAYVTFEGDRAQIVSQDLLTGRRALISDEPGINAAPAWSPDGRQIALVLSKDGNAEIYIKEIATNRFIRVTNNPAIDTEPAWSSDGKSLYFTSDRSGVPQLYRIDLTNGRVARINNTGRYSAGVDVSPDGELLAFSRNRGRGFVIGIFNIKSRVFGPITKGSEDREPIFSPNGKMLIFTSVDHNRSVLKIVNVDGSGLINTLSIANGQIRDADWSTYINN